MKLYLTSAHLGKDPTRLLELLGANPRVGLISNALDEIADESIVRFWEESAQCGIAGLGLPCDRLDLREYFAGGDIESALRQFGLVWALGGNAFVLRRAMYQSGFDQVIRPLLAQEQLIYVGTSAGSVVAGPTLRGFELVDEPDVVVPCYSGEVIWDGLGLIDFTIVPHYASDNPEIASAISRVITAIEDNQHPYQALADTQVIVVRGTTITVSE